MKRSQRVWLAGSALVVAGVAGVMAFTFWQTERDYANSHPRSDALAIQLARLGGAVTFLALAVVALAAVVVSSAVRKEQP